MTYGPLVAGVGMHGSGVNWGGLPHLSSPVLNFAFRKILTLPHIPDEEI